MWVRPGRTAVLATSIIAVAACGHNNSSTGTAVDVGPDATVGRDAASGPALAEAGSDGSGGEPETGSGGSNQTEAAAGDAAALTPGAFTVNLAKTYGAVTRKIYGHNWLSPAQMAWNTVGRYGGNPLSVFNWSADYYNSAADYYFKGMPVTWSNYANWEDFVDAGQSTETTMLFVVPTLGWVAQGAVACVYPFSELPHQQDYEHTLANPDGGQQLACSLQPGAGATCCGNGIDADSGAPLDAAVDLDAAYMRSSPSDAVAWLQAIKAKMGAAAFSNVMVGLDNEPDWWNISHRDVHPQQATIAEIWSTNEEYAAAIKAAFPGISILGPDLVAWYNTSEVQTYLTDVATYNMQKGVQLVDYLDLHFYPSYYTFSFGCDQVPAAQRLQGARLFWDPTYLNPYDGLPATEAPELIPRYKNMIASTPGATALKLAITEYNVGTDACAAGAVAEAETLAVFGRYGLDLATRWSDSGYAGHYQLTAGSPAESAFRMYLEHDVTGTSVQVDAAAGGAGFSVDQVTAYAVVNGSTLDVLLFNKQAAAASVTVQLGSATAKAGSAFQFSATNTALASIAAPGVSGGLTTVVLPAQSATLVVATLP
jgi:hypothetical protein